jgi:hypothetical protein
VNESWIIEDTKMDKSALYGFELPVGTWMLSTHIEDTEDWNTYVKSGLTKGYSIEGNFALDLVEALNKISMVEPRTDESKDEYVGRCIGYHVSQEGMDSSQAAAICYTKWDEAKMSKEELRNRKISWDFDNVLTTRAAKEMVRRQIRNGEIVYIISARNSASAMYGIADELGIPRERVIATGNNTAKIQKIKELQIVNHYDNNTAVVKQLPRVGVKFSITAEEALELITEILKQDGKS